MKAHRGVLASAALARPSGGALVLCAVCGACGSPTETSRSTPTVDGSAGRPDARDAAAAPLADGASTVPSDSDARVGAVDGVDGSDAPLETGSEAGSGFGGLPADRFVTSVVSLTPGPCAGYGAARMPDIVEGPPKGGGASKGSVDVVSLGAGGEIVLSFAPNAIVDRPGVDFIVFENPFDIGGNPQDPYAEPGEVSVSDDGTTWTTYPCTATSYPYGQCAGWHPVYSAPGNGISPVDPTAAGGDPFDLADVGLTRARFVRIRDKSGEVCPDAGGPNTDGFDLDAISIVNAEMP